MKTILIIIFITYLHITFGIYDKYLNRDISLSLRTNPHFYASKYLYSTHYIKVNNSTIIFS